MIGELLFANHYAPATNHQPLHCHQFTSIVTQVSVLVTPAIWPVMPPRNTRGLGPCPAAFAASSPAPWTCGRRHRLINESRELGIAPADEPVQAQHDDVESGVWRHRLEVRPTPQGGDAWEDLPSWGAPLS